MTDHELNIISSNNHQNIDGEKKMTDLHHFCKEGSLKEVKESFKNPLRPMDETDYASDSGPLYKQNEPYGNTPLHLAVLFGHEDIVKYLATEKKHKEQFKDLLSQKNAVNDTPVHIAARCGHLNMLKMMFNADNECIMFEGRLKQAPIHYASGFGHVKVVEYFLSKDKDKKLLEFQTIPLDINPFERTTECPKAVETIQLLETHKKAIKKQAERTAQGERDEQWTPLTYACHFGNEKVVHYLLSVGAKPHPVALQKAIEGGYEGCARLLLLVDDPTRDNNWRDILEKSYTPEGKSIPTTPFHELINHMPSVAEVVLHNCTKMDRYFVNKREFTMECSYDFVSDQKSNSSDSNRDSESFEHPISLMVKRKRKELLTHPVVACYIYDQWKLFGWWLSLTNLLFYTVFQVMFFTILIFLMPHPLANNVNSCCLNDDDSYGMNNVTMIMNSTTESVIGLCTEVIDKNIAAVRGIAAFVFIHALIRWIFEIGQLIFSIYTAVKKTKKDKYYQRCIVRLHYFKSWMNWIELPLYTLTLIFIISLFIMIQKDLCLPEWQWQIGAFVMLLTWFELIVFFSQFQLVGVYALMFVRVLSTFARVMTLALLLIIAFTLTFYMLLSHPGYQNSPFMYAGRSILKIMAMSTGELNSDSFFRYRDRSDITGLPFPTATIMLWIIFLVFMTILLTNMLVGLAVGDIRAVYKEAEFEKLSLEVKYILNIERQLKFVRCCGCLLNKKKSKEIKPNAPKSVREDVAEWFISAIWGVLRYDSPEGIERVILYYSQKNKPRSDVELSKVEDIEDKHKKDNVDRQNSTKSGDATVLINSEEQQPQNRYPKGNSWCFVQ